MKINQHTPTGRVVKGSESEADKGRAQPGTYSIIGAYQGDKVRFRVGKYDLEIRKDELEHLLSHWNRED